MSEQNTALTQALLDTHMVFSDDSEDLAKALLESDWLAAHDAEVAAAERERCARIADAEGSDSYPGEDAGFTAERIAARIREGEQRARQCRVFRADEL